MRGERAARLLASAALLLVGWALPVRALETTLAGRRLDLTGHGEARQVLEVDEDTEAECTFLQLWLRTRYSLADGLHFETVASGQYGGPATESTGAGIYTFDQVFQSRSPSLELEEAFLDWQTNSVDLRVGKQKFAWGKLDRFQAVDVLNTERFSDFLLEEDERKIGVPAVQVSYSLPGNLSPTEESRLTLVWIPQYLPFRFPLPGERWFPPAAVPPDPFPVPELECPRPMGMTRTVDGFSVPVSFATTNRSAPGFDLGNSGYAARFSGFAAGVDYALYYYHGFDSQPAFQLSAEAMGVANPNAANMFDVTAATELRPIFRRIDLWGADAAYAWGPLTMRAEAAYVRGRPFSRDLRSLIDNPDQLAPQICDALEQFDHGASTVAIDLSPSFVERDAVEWGFGVDYDLSGYLLLLQVNQTDVLENHVDLLIEDVETRLLANLRKSFLHDDLTAQLIAQHAIESDYSLLLPRLTYQVWRGLQVRVGYLFIAGRRSSVIGQYKKNDEAFLRLRYLF